MPCAGSASVDVRSRAADALVTAAPKVVLAIQSADCAPLLLWSPEGVIGAAHAGCFSMALAHALAEAGHEATRVETTARVHLEPTEDGPTITRIELQTEGEVPGLDADEFHLDGHRWKPYEFQPSCFNFSH